MFKFFQKSQQNLLLGTQPFVLNVSELRDNERLEFNYDRNNNLVAIQKVKLSRLNQSIEGVAETNIEPGHFGRVWYSGTSWKAVTDGDYTIAAGQNVLVRARKNLTLLVIPSSTTN